MGGRAAGNFSASAVSTGAMPRRPTTFWRLWSFLVALAVGPVLAGCHPGGAPLPPAARGSRHALVVNTDRGPVSGAPAPANTRAFLAIPYAAPPTGALRWRPPRPPAPWTVPRPEAVAPVAARYHGSDSIASFVTLMLDGAFVCEARRAARTLASQGRAVFLYEFTHALDSPLHALGATHSAELPLVFGTAEGVFRVSPREEPLSHLMMDAWGRFARTGDPSGPDLAWPRYTAENDTLAVLDLQPTLARGVKAEACAFWDAFGRTLR